MFNPEEFLYELSKYVDPHSILVIDKEGKLRRIFCPFFVAARIRIYTFHEGEVLIVDAVKVTLTLEDVYIINGKAYLIGYFRIIG
ncbi:MAG TPA: hypothetical protein PK563_15420 [Tenuifilaceae bacterium]|nr:hypothetical protein [Tenuifilaceae bacterium]